MVVLGMVNVRTSVWNYSFVPVWVQIYLHIITIGEHRDLHLLGELLRAKADPSTHAIRQQLLEAIEKRQKLALKRAVVLEVKLRKQKRKAILAPARKSLG